MREIRQLDYTVLICHRLGETKAFYRDVMGFTLEADRENWVDFRIGGTILSLRTRSNTAPWDDGESVPGPAAVQLAFRVPLSALDGCYAQLVSLGVPIVRQPTDIASARHRTVFFRDPEGNLLEIYAEY